MYINGYSYRQIIKCLNEKGFKTKTGKGFGSNSIYSILDNEKYSGVYVFNKSSKKDAFGRRNSHLYKEPSEVIKIDGGMSVIISKETFQKAREMMISRKKAPGANKAKELYLLSGLIYCGYCGRAMQGNRRNPKNKPKYCSYRCGTRMQGKFCDNKEIRKEYIEEFVLAELEKNILNDKAIPYLVKKINEYLEKQSTSRKGELERFKCELQDVEKQIGNIVSAITNGFFQQAFKDKMIELEEKKAKLEMQIKEIEVKRIDIQINEEQVKSLFSMFRKFVIERNLPECKKFIHNYVQRVDIFKDHVEVIFNVVFDFLKEIKEIKIKSKIKKRDLIKRYSNSFYIGISV